MEIPQVREGEPERGIERNGKDRSHNHAEVLRIGQRLEQPPFLSLQCEDWDKGDRDHE
jgi:hypothetical protein